MKTNTEPTAIEKLKEHRMQLIDFARNAGDYYLVAQLERENEEINQALSEAERKAWDAAKETIIDESTILGKIRAEKYGHLEDWRDKHGAKI